MLYPHIYQLGDQAITISFDDSINETANTRAINTANILKRENLPGIHNLVIAYNSLTLVYDASIVKRFTHEETVFAFLETKLKQTLATTQANLTIPVNKKIVPACYHLSVAPDIEELAAEKNLSVETLITLHTKQTYRVYMLGFLPGFAYMGTVDERLRTSRKQTPHTHIPAGSIGIAGEQTGIYPLDSPGGWNIIGRTPLQLFKPTATDPCFFQTGDEVQFEPISLEKFHALNTGA